MMRRRVEADENGATSSIPADHREYPNGGLNADFGKGPKTFPSLDKASSPLQILTIVASFAMLVGPPSLSFSLCRAHFDHFRRFKVLLTSPSWEKDAKVTFLQKGRLTDNFAQNSSVLAACHASYASLKNPIATCRAWP